jgi:amino acid transporter
VPALVAMCVVSIAMVMADISMLINAVGFTYSLVFFMVVLGLLKLRYQHPEMERPIKVKFFFD